MGCTTTNQKYETPAKREIVRFIQSRLQPQEIEILNLIYDDLASRIPEKKVNIENFLLFFHKTGEWGDRLFKEFDSDQSDLICIEQFVKGIAKIFKTDEKTKINLLFSFFSSRSTCKNDGIMFSDLLTMLYNYPKDGLKRILSDEEFVDHEIRKRLIEVKNNRRLESIYRGGGLNEVVECRIEDSDTGSEPMQSAYGFKGVLERLKKPKNEATSIRINVQGKSIEVKTNNIHHLVKKFAKSIFKEYDLSPEHGRLSAECFEKWVIKHKQLYTNYYDGFHNEVWEYEHRKHCPKYLLTACEMESEGKTYVNGALTSVYMYLYHSTIIVTHQLEHDMPLVVVILDGLAVKKSFSKAEGFGIEVSHRDDFYHRKKFYFKNEKIMQEWMELLKFYRGVTIQQQYEIGKKIGTGKFSVVYEAKQLASGQLFAIKVIENSQLDQEARTLIAHESSIMAVVNHPLLVWYKETVQTKTHLYIITELVNGKDLFEHVKIHERLSEVDAAHITRQLIIGVKYMHSMGIIHRDLKPQNLMILDESEDHEDNLKIIDFGFSNYLSRLRETNPEDLLAGTPGYIAPEILRNDPISYKIDNFAIGAIIYFALSGSVPFNGFSIQEMFQKTLHGVYDYDDKVWFRISDEAKNLIDRFLNPEPDERICLQEALHHPWFRKTNSH